MRSHVPDECSSGLPDGWAYASLGDLADVLDHLRVPVNSEERQNRPGSIPYYGATGQVGWIDDYLFDEELVLLGEDGAPFLDKSKSIAYIVSGKAWVNNHAHVLRAVDGLTTNHFIKWALDATDFTDHVNGTTRLKLTQAAMRSSPTLLPPLAEQKRIVAKVEEVLARVNAARERLAKLPTILKRFRQSVLAAACSGRLTADWREQHGGEGDEPSRWVDVINEGAFGEFNFSELPPRWCWASCKSLCDINRDHVWRYQVRTTSIWRYSDPPFIRCSLAKNR